MKIIIEEQEDKLLFSDLAIGDVFNVKGKSNVYMKTNPTLDTETMINMGTGEAIIAHNNYEVTKLEAILTVKPVKQ